MSVQVTGKRNGEAIILRYEDMGVVDDTVGVMATRWWIGDEYIGESRSWWPDAVRRIADDLGFLMRKGVADIAIDGAPPGRIIDRFISDNQLDEIRRLGT